MNSMPFIICAAFAALGWFVGGINGALGGSAIVSFGTALATIIDTTRGHNV